MFTFRYQAGPDVTSMTRSLSAGDVVAVGGTLLAVGRPAGWEPVTGPLTEVRTREHGTSPLPLPGSAPGHRAGTSIREGGPR